MDKKEFEELNKENWKRFQEKQKERKKNEGKRI
jgi:hypothetical protein